MSTLTRRSVLGGLLAVAVGVGTARTATAAAPSEDLDGSDLDDAAPVADTIAAERLTQPTLIEGSFVSAAMNGATVGWAVSYPPGTTVDSLLPVVLALHGSDGNHLDAFHGLGFQDAQASEVGATPVAIVSVDAQDGFYHRRADGTDTGAMIADELLPILADRGLDTSRLGLTGWSMGGYGALLLAATRLHGKVRAVAPISAGLWHSYAQAEEGAFDSRADYAAHDVFGMRDVLADVPMRVACGLSDGFLEANQDFVAGFEDSATMPESSFEAGGHEAGYWSATSPGQVAFLSQYLT